MFVPLRIHSVYSRGRGGVTLEEASGWAAAQRLPAAGLADIGNIYGWGKWKRVAPAGGYSAALRLRARSRRPAVRLPGQDARGLLEPHGDLQPPRDPRRDGTRRDLRAGAREGWAVRGRGTGTRLPRGHVPRHVPQAAGAGRARRRCWPTCARRSRRAISTSGRSSRISSMSGPRESGTCTSDVSPVRRAGDTSKMSRSPICPSSGPTRSST
ncbi:MAG: hypothetical protein M0C28_35465 [Candidatus Moduliflexus flocculans]|nr:hypothetical protein [Candidatus Moduliflexus flocculans]